MAGVKVDRYLKQLPERFFDERGQLTQEGEEWFEYDNRWKQAVWSKLGGTDDFVVELQNGELYEPGIQTSNADDLIEELEVEAEMAGQTVQVRDLEIIELAAAQTAITTTGDQLVICNNTAAGTVTLNSLPDDGEEAVIARRNAGVTMIGVINGKTNPTLAMKLDTAHLKFSVAAGEWVVI